MDLTLACAPLIMLDSLEPFPFTDVAVTVLTPGDRSPSTGHVLEGPGDHVIEYALWCDMEIGHAYELEHVWVFVDRNGRVLRVRASAHGDMVPAETPADGERVRVYSEPGKHGMAARHSRYAISRELTTTLCDAAAGTMGVHTAPKGADLGCNVEQYRKAWNVLRTHRFTPAWDAGRELDVRDLTWLTWDSLKDVRRARGLAAIAHGSSAPVGVPCGPWGAHTDAWVVGASRGTGALLLAGQAPGEVFSAAQQASRLLVVVADTAGLVTDLHKSAWDHYASACTLIVSPGPASISRVAALAVPAGQSTGSTQLEVSPRPLEDRLTIGPGGDYDCPLELLAEHGWQA